MIRFSHIGSAISVLILISLFSNASFSQTNTLNVVICDQLNKIPVSYTSVALIHKNAGTTSTDDGKFTIKIDTSTINDTLAFSRVGYQTKRISLKELSEQKSPTVFLFEKPVEMKAITVSSVKTKSKKHRKTIVLNEIKHRIDFKFRRDKLKTIYGQNSKRYQTAVLFKVSSKSKSEWNIDKIIITLSDGTSSNQPMKFNLRFYQYDSINNMPGIELYNKPVLVNAHNDMIKEVNLKDYKIQIPDEYFFVAVEWLIIDENRDTNLNSIILTKPNWYFPLLVELWESQDIFGVWDLNFNQNWVKRSEEYWIKNSLDISVILRD